jgi:hypothetical protein
VLWAYVVVDARQETRRRLLNCQKLCPDWCLIRKRRNSCRNARIDNFAVRKTVLAKCTYEFTYVTPMARWCVEAAVHLLSNSISESCQVVARNASLHSKTFGSRQQRHGYRDRETLQRLGRVATLNAKPYKFRHPQCPPRQRPLPFTLGE